MGRPRHRDSPVASDENTADIVEQHTGSYIAAIHKINRILHEDAVWELDRVGSACICTCPGCGFGICVCSVSGRKSLSDSWAEVGPIAGETEVLVHPPRPGSAAANAGIRHGDAVVAVDGKELQSYSALQTAVKGHEPGETVELRVRRASGELEKVAVTRPW